MHKTEQRAAHNEISQRDEALPEARPHASCVILKDQSSHRNIS